MHPTGPAGHPRTSPDGGGGDAAPRSPGPPPPTGSNSTADAPAEGGTAAPVDPAGRTEPQAGSRRAGWLGAIVHLVFEGAKFGAVGAIAFVVDNGLYLLLVGGPAKLLAPWPVRASILASTVAVAVSYVGNRYWTFSKTRSRAGPGRRSRMPLREMLAFAAANAIGVLITGACLYVSRWILDQHSAGADVLARNVGIALGTVFRYLAYKFWVFTGSARKP